MARVEIDTQRCKGCGYCCLSCPQKLLVLGEDLNSSGYRFALWLQEESCSGCALCAEVCPDVAIEVYS